MRHSGPSEALLLSGSVAGSEPASVIFTLAAECRSFVLWSERHCAGRMLVHAGISSGWPGGTAQRCAMHDCVSKKTLTILVSNACTCTLLVNLCCIIRPTVSIMNKHT